MNYFQDFYVDQRIIFGRYTVTQAEIIEFAERYDPQAFHVNQDHPLTMELGGIMASGWHSTAIFMRLAVDAYLGDAAVLTSPGVDALRAFRALRPLRLVSRYEDLKITVATLFKSIPAMTSLISVAMLFFVIFGILYIEVCRLWIYMFRHSVRDIAGCNPSVISLMKFFGLPCSVRVFVRFKFNKCVINRRSSGC